MSAPKRIRLTSVTTLLGGVIPRPGLEAWKIAQTAEGATILARAGERLELMTGAELLKEMRRNGVGADAVGAEAADRGTNVHKAVERYVREPHARNLPDPLRDKIDMKLWGYHHGAARWLMSVGEIEPIAIEELVADPAAGFAGRVDLRARISGRLKTIDFTTSEKLAIHGTKVAQTFLYERGARICGDEPADDILVVSFSPRGEIRTYERPYRHETTQRMLDWLDEWAPIDKGCEAANRVEREALKEVEAEADAEPPAPAVKVAYVEGDPSTHPGAMETTMRRDLPDGSVIEFEFAPWGWTTLGATRRKRDHRAYWYTPAAQMVLEAA